MAKGINQLKYSVLISYGSIIFSILAGLFYTPWMISQIGKDNYGLYSLVSVFLSYFLLDFGISSVISTYVSKSRAANDFDKLKNIVGVCYKAFFIITALIGLILFIVYFFISDIFVSFTPEECHRFKVIYCIAGIFSVINFPFTPLNGIILAYEKLVTLKLLDFWRNFISISLIIICLLNDLGLYALVAVNSIVGFGISIYKFFYVKKKLYLDIEFKEHIEKKLLKELVQFSGWAFLMGIAQRFIIGAAPTILGITSGASSVAVFSIAMTLEGYFWTFSNAVNGLFIPRVAKYVTEDLSTELLTDKMINVGRIQLFAMGTLIGGLFCLGRPFINLWVGPQFSLSFYTALLIVSPQLILVTQEIGNTLLWVKNLINYRCIVFLIGGLANIIGSFLLSLKFEALGCGIGIFISQFIIIILLNYLFKNKLRLNISRFYKRCHLTIIPFLSIPVIFFILMQRFYSINAWTEWLCFAIIYVTISVIICFSLMSQQEKQLILRNKRN